MDERLHDDNAEDDGSSAWEHEQSPLNDPEERRVLFAALDSFL